MRSRKDDSPVFFIIVTICIGLWWFTSYLANELEVDRQTALDTILRVFLVLFCYGVYKYLCGYLNYNVWPLFLASSYIAIFPVIDFWAFEHLVNASPLYENIYGDDSSIAWYGRWYTKLITCIGLIFGGYYISEKLKNIRFRL